MQDTINWGAAALMSRTIDEGTSSVFRSQPMAQHFARISKCAEEVGEAVEAFIGCTGQNFRKGVTHKWGDVYSELCDVTLTGAYALTHFVGAEAAKQYIQLRLEYHHKRVDLPWEEQ